MTRMIGLFLVVTLGGLGAVAACSSKSSSSPNTETDSGTGGGGDTGGGGGNDTSTGGGGLVGSYDMCTLTPDVMITAPAMLTYSTALTGGSATISGSGSALTLVVNGGDSGLDCSLAITASGDMATVGMQSCDATIEGIPVVITFTSGTATLSGTALSAMASITVSGVDGGTAVAGTGTFTATCTKM
jgi:hypothetical protein